MGLYRARDLLLLPSLVSFTRVPLAVAFPFVVGRPAAALAVLMAAGLSDVLDGWLARARSEATPTGAAIDPVTDKIFVLTVAITLLVVDKLTLLDVLLLSTREIGEAPLVVWLGASSRARQRRSEHPRANLPGKLATTLQFATVVTVLFDWQHHSVMILLTALAGVVAAASYWWRSVHMMRAPRRDGAA
jgi:CDP-diacylglycerol--glycerol-3-phosphate 3-phosphatidyltransferase/cardiolipin synthase